VKAKQKKRTTPARFKSRLHRHLKLTFIPHKENQYRPHLIRRYGLMTILILVIAAQAGYIFSSNGKVLGDESTVTESALLQETNNERAKDQIAPLKMNAKLSQAAFLKGQDMLKRQYWGHDAPDGTTPWQWFDTVGYNYTYAGENLAKNFHTVEAVTAAWMASSEHRANILNAHYSEAGFAVVSGILSDKPVTLVVALYGEPVSLATTAMTQTSTSAPVEKSESLVERAGMAVQSMTPLALGSVILMLIAAIVALLAHMNRNKLPKNLRQSWYRHHGLMKVGGMLSLCLIILFLYSGGQI